MHIDLLSYLGLGLWMAIMLFAMVSFEIDAYKRRKHKRIIANEAPALGVFRWLLKIGNRPEESILCQQRCLAPARELMEDIKELIVFHRPCLQYPLSDHWWQLNNCDYAKGSLSAILRFPEGVGNLRLLDITCEIVWSFQKHSPGEIEVRLDWFRLDPWDTRYKHNIFLSMAAYTEERIRRLNSGIEMQNAAKAAANQIGGIQSRGIHGGGKQGLSIANDGLKLLPGRTSESLSWPSPQDYNEAVQNPTSCFVDDDLVSGEVEQNSLGMPKVVSGSFASVYRICGKNRDWAVRCFLSPVRDQQMRYAVLTKHLALNSASAIVDFSFVEHGIKVRDKSYPILKMEWIDGLPLHIYVENNLRCLDKMANLRLAFQEMVCNLRQAKIAHGDLQHGNILVRGDQLLLVDYDGMFVPELASFHSAELGHPNYQHPRREGKHFGLFLDNFAGWLIDTSLICLAEDPFLWDRFSGGDECLLFRRSDLISPQESKIFNYLLEHSSAQLKAATVHFLSLLQLELEEIPFLEISAPQISE